MHRERGKNFLSGSCLKEEAGGRDGFDVSVGHSCKEQAALWVTVGFWGIGEVTALLLRAVSWAFVATIPGGNPSHGKEGYNKCYNWSEA